MLDWLFRSAGNAERLIARGNQAEKEGRLGEACELYRKAVAIGPRSPKAHLNLGVALEALGDTGGATACLERALQLDPADPYANYNLGRLRYAAGALAEAERLFAQALRGRADFREASFMLACVLDSQGSYAAAAAGFEALLRRQPEDFGALYHYAGVLRKLGRLDEAQAALKRARAIEPENADAAAALADLLQARGDLAGAAAELEALLGLRPDWVEALYNYGTTLMSLQREADAEAALRRVVDLDAHFLPAYRMLGSLLHKQGRVAEALELLRAARERHPQDFDLSSFELFLLNFSPDIDAEALFERHRAFGERLERAQPSRFAFAQRSQPGQRLRIGYVSSEFNYHPVGLFMLPVLERHDRSQFEVYCYSTSAKADAFTRRLSAHADAWREASALADAELAEAIHRDRIDILVDLAGHSGIPRLGVFAQQPAPVQAAWLGYLNTTGLTRMRYRITDAVSDPPGAERAHTETLVRLPHAQWCYRPFLSLAHAPAPPLARKGHVTFGSFGQAAKLSSLTRRLWAQVLQRLPEARLVVAGVAEGRAAQDLLRDLAGAGIAPQRVTLAPFMPLREYFGGFDAVDIALDTAPYSGATTTCDALWMGVPVLTFPGARPVSRSASSILCALGLPQWIAAGAEDYVRRAVELAGERELLAGLRVSLRERMRASPLMDEARFTRDLEQAYLGMLSNSRT